MKIEYAATPEDIGALYSHLWKNSGYFRLKTVVGTSLVAAWILLAIYLSQGELILRDAFIAVNVAIAFPLLTPFVAMLRTKRGNRSLSIDPAGIHTKIGPKEGNVRWQRISQVFVTADHIFILSRNLDSFTIPNRAFQSETQREEFIRLCQDYSSQLVARTAGRVFRWWILALSAALLAIFTPSLYELAWHLKHGNAFRYNDKSVPVPRGWIANTKSQNPALIRIPSTLFALVRFQGPTSKFFVSKGSPLKGMTVQQADDSFEKLFWTYPPQQAYFADINGPVKIGSPPNDIFCMTATHTRNDSKVYVKCLFQQATWGAEFLGDKRDTGNFYEILQGIH